jgi:hypothetical protein
MTAAGCSSTILEQTRSDKRRYSMWSGGTVEASSSPVILWSVTINGNEARCEIDRGSSRQEADGFSGTLLFFLNGRLSVSQSFRGSEEFRLWTAERLRDYRHMRQAWGWGDPSAGN